MERDADFTAYVAGRWGMLVRSAVLLGCPPHRAEDLVQTTLAKCYVAWARVTRADNPDAYVYRVLVNCHIESQRRKWWAERPTANPPDSTLPRDDLALVDVSDAIERALGTLSPVLRAVVVLRFYADLSEAETASALDVPRGTVKSRLSRALATLAASSQLADLGDGSPHD